MQNILRLNYQLPSASSASGKFSVSSAREQAQTTRINVQYITTNLDAMFDFAFIEHAKLRMMLTRETTRDILFQNRYNSLQYKLLLRKNSRKTQEISGKDSKRKKHLA